MADKNYTVKQGDTLESLAKTFYNDPIHADSLRKINKIAPQDNVRVAMNIILPPRVVSIGSSEKDSDKTVKNVHYGKLQEKSNCLFPLPKEFQDKGYRADGRSFGYVRKDKKHPEKIRSHAGCDLYAQLGTPIYAVADGVILDYHFFYWKTFCLEVNHGEFSIVYGEVQPPADPNKLGIQVTKEVEQYIAEIEKDEKKGLPNNLRKGSQVKRGDHIAFVGQLYQNNGSTPFEQTMLHFEKYSNKASGAFTQVENTTDYINDIPKKPYKRRKDLEDPTDFLDNCVFID
jgi:murein DD-endopeptidase MepM/ murein hydrolase activator NlpD